MMTSNFPDNEDDDGDDDNDSKSNITITTKITITNDNNADHDDNHDDPFHRDSSVTTVPHNDQDEGESQMIFIIIHINHINMTRLYVRDAILSDWLRNLL